MRAEGAPIDTATVVDVAAQLVETEGVDKLTLSMIARELGVTQPALYKHIDGLDALWRELGLLERRELRAALAESCLGRSGPDAVRAVAHAWCSFASARPGLYRSAARTPVAGDEELEASVASVAEVLELVLQAFDLDPAQVCLAARALRSALHGYASFELVTGNPAPYNPSDTLDHIVELFLVGVQSLAAGSISSLTATA